MDIIFLSRDRLSLRFHARFAWKIGDKKIIEIFVGAEKIIGKKWKFGEEEKERRKGKEGRYLVKFCKSEPRKVK